MNKILTSKILLHQNHRQKYVICISLGLLCNSIVITFFHIAEMARKENVRKAKIILKHTDHTFIFSRECYKIHLMLSNSYIIVLEFFIHLRI